MEFTTPKRPIRAYLSLMLRRLIRSVLLEFNAVKTGRYLYHSSNPINRESIQVNGLRPERGEQWMADTKIEGKAVFATDSEDRKDHFDSSYDDDFWRIDTHRCPEIKWSKDPNFDWGDFKHVYTTQTVPPHALELVHKGTGANMEGAEGQPHSTWLYP